MKKRNRTSEKEKRIFVSDVGCEKEFQTFVGKTFKFFFHLKGETKLQIRLCTLDNVIIFVLL